MKILREKTTLVLFFQLIIYKKLRILLFEDIESLQAYFIHSIVVYV